MKILFHLCTEGYTCMHVHNSVHKVCPGKFLFLSFSERACHAPTLDVAVTTVRTLFVVFSMPCTEALPNQSSSNIKLNTEFCHACRMCVLHVCELHYLNVFVCQHWAWRCLQCMLTKSWPALRLWIMDWLVVFRFL